MVAQHGINNLHPVPMSEPCWTLVQCWTNIGPTQKQISPTVALEAKTGQMSDAHLPSTALIKIGPIKSTFELQWGNFFWLDQCWPNVGPMSDIV